MSSRATGLTEMEVVTLYKQLVGYLEARHGGELEKRLKQGPETLWEAAGAIGHPHQQTEQ